MSDLSNLLGDVYGDQHSPDAAPVRREPAAAQRAPEWSSESQLDKAFEGWVPGEPPAARQPDPAGDDLSAALAAALSADRIGVAPSQPAPAPAPAPAQARLPEPAPMPTLAHTLADLGEARTETWTAPVAAPQPAAPAPQPAAYPAAPAAPVAAWSPGDDDIFPLGRGGKKSKAKAAKAPKGRKAKKVKA